MKWQLAILCVFAFFGGAVAGFYGAALGSHGGEAWPATLLSGPAMAVALLFGDSILYVYSMMFFTGLLYAAYVAAWPRLRLWLLLLILLLHGVVGVPLMLSSMRSG